MSLQDLTPRGERRTGWQWRPSWLQLPANDLLRERVYRRLWISILISSLGSQITMLALPLTAAVLLAATPSQMGLLTAMEILPFVLLSLPSGVWLDRVRKLPVYVAGEAIIALVLISVPVAWGLGFLSMPFMYCVGFIIGGVFVTAGSAAQIVLTQVVPRHRLVEAHARNALASSGAEVAGPGLAGALIKLTGAPLALLADALMLTMSVFILRGMRIVEVRVPNPEAHFWLDMKDGLRFVMREPLLVALSATVGIWHMFHYGALTMQILFATRELHLNEHQVGLCYMIMGIGTIVASMLGNRFSRWFGPGPCLILGFAVCGAGWMQLGFAPVNAWGIASFIFMLLCYSFGAVLIFVNMLALRQAVTPEGLMGRMTSTVRWLMLIPAGPGALLGGYIGEHFGLRYTLVGAGLSSIILAAWAWRYSILAGVAVLPSPQNSSVGAGDTASVRT
ncbi:MAG: MFS transporter [Rhodocyclaceae bacterium]|nr:MFS transporter [Rhodocyclaceae bacterium]